MSKKKATKKTVKKATKKTVKKVQKPRLRTFVVWLSNHTDRRDDETIRVKAHSKEEARSLAQYDETRFSIRTVFTLAESRMNWV